MEHAGTVYTITRTQKYQLSSTGTLKSKLVKPAISYKDSQGKQQFIKESMIEGEINKILPSELSGYFFFDGERINNMSKQIQKSKGTTTFGEAVRRLLGLDSYKAAMKHLKEGQAGNNVISVYNNSLSTSSDATVSRLSKEREEFEKQLERCETRITELEEAIPELQSAIDELNVKIERNKDGEHIRSQIKSLESMIAKNNNEITDSGRKIRHAFRLGYRNYFASKLMADAIIEVAKTDQFDKGIPRLHKQTIDFLLNRGVCVCGTPLHEGTAEYMQLQKALEYALPQSIGTTVRTFAEACKANSRNVSNVYESVKSVMLDLTNRQSDNEDLLAQVSRLEEQLKGFEAIGEYQKKVQSYRTDKSHKERELGDLREKVGALKTKIERRDTEIHKLSMQSKNNRQIELYKAYATRMYEILKTQYDEKESAIRKELEKAVNEIYSDIYNGEVTLHLDEKYNIETRVSGFTNVETGTAQGISIIFAFIAGVIKMAKHYNKDEYLSTEPYPLVMDAPLSAFDKGRIKSVCETLPNIAEQVIIFIKDTDGELAEEHMADKIGKKYSFVKVDKLETHIERGGTVV